MSKKIPLFARVESDKNIPVVQLRQVIESHNAGWINHKYVVYAIDKNQYGCQYKAINLETKSFRSFDYMEPLRNQCGIGVYYDDINPEFLDEEIVKDLLLEATELQKQKDDTAAQKKQSDEDLKAIGRKKLSEIIPEDAVAAIIAKQKIDKSDSMTDYFGSSTVRTVILGFSKSKRDNFTEMRKFAAHFPETLHLADKDPGFEHREKYTGGSGYYLAKRCYSGWQVSKETIYNRGSFIEYHALTAGDAKNICLPPQGKNKKLAAGETEIFTYENLHLELINYSDKAVALFGDTKQVKDKLGEIGGSFNSALRYGDTRKPGWVFPRKLEAAIRRTFSIPV